MSEAQANGAASSEVILVLDADPKRQEFYTNFVEKSGNYKIEIETSAQKGLDKLNQSGSENKYGLVIIDWQLPDMPGHILAQKIRAQTKFDNIELAALSNSISSDDLVLLSELDISVRIQKSESGPGILQQIEPVMKARGKVELGVLAKIQQFKDAIAKEELESCEKLIKSHPDLETTMMKSHKHIVVLAHMHLLLKNLPHAMKILERAYDSLSNKDKGLRILGMMARVHAHAGRHQEALKIYDRLLNKSPKNLDHKIGKGDAHLDAGNIEQAKEQFKEVLKNDPSNTQAAVGMGKSAVVEGNFDQAASLFQNIKGDFENEGLASFFNNRAVALAKSGKANEALALYQSASKFIKKYKTQITFNMGLTYTKMGKNKEAKQCFDEVLKTADAKFVEKKGMLKKIKELKNKPETKPAAKSAGTEEFTENEEKEDKKKNTKKSA